MGKWGLSRRRICYVGSQSIFCWPPWNLGRFSSFRSVARDHTRVRVLPQPRPSSPKLLHNEMWSLYCRSFSNICLHTEIALPQPQHSVYRQKCFSKTKQEQKRYWSRAHCCRKRKEKWELWLGRISCACSRTDQRLLQSKSSSLPTNLMCNYPNTTTSNLPGRTAHSAGQERHCDETRILRYPNAYSYCQQFGGECVPIRTKIAIMFANIVENKRLSDFILYLR